MKSFKKATGIILPVLIMLMLIIDSKASVQAASQGIDLCIRTVIPSLFPFFYISGLIRKSLNSRTYKFLRPIGKLCGIPQGAEPIMLLGYLGGYPIGAQSINSAYKAGNLSRKDAERMLGFCNQSGPAFLFGIVGSLFQNPYIPFLIWIILLCSAVLTGAILPNKAVKPCTMCLDAKSKPFEDAITATVSVCGWVILFRILYVILYRWVFFMLPDYLTVLFVGFLELTNGCVILSGYQNQSLRFIMTAVFLSFGGICVAMQTRSVAKGLSCKTYFLGKIIQTIIVTILSSLISIVIFI